MKPFCTGKFMWRQPKIHPSKQAASRDASDKGNLLDSWDHINLSEGGSQQINRFKDPL